MKKIMLTGFEPFGEWQENSSQEVLKMLPNEFCGAEIIKLTVPVVFGTAAKIVCDELIKVEPFAVVCMGQRSLYDGISVERVAINCMDSNKADNTGYVPHDEKINETGDNAYFSTLPIKRINEAWQSEGFKSKVSNTAGTFVCNSLMYGVLDCIIKNNLPMQAGFIHLSLKGKMSYSDSTRAMESALKTIIEQ